MPIPADQQIPPVPLSGSNTEANSENAQSAEPAKIEQARGATSQTQKHPSPTEKTNSTIDNQRTSPANSAEPGTTSAVEGTQPQPSPTPAVQDRRWIIRTPPPDSKKAKPAPVKPVKWTSDSQKKQCEKNLEQLRGAFLKARYYSIQGDSCACAENADHFLNIYEKAHAACPDHFLENEGYSNRITRNMAWLKALGEKRCLGPKTAPEAHPESTATHHPADATASPGPGAEDLTNTSGKPPEGSDKTLTRQPATAPQ